MIVQNLGLGISHGIYENAFHFLQCNGNGRDGEKVRQTILWSLAVIKLLTMKLKSYVLLL